MLIIVEALHNERKGKDALEDSMIVDLYLQRDEKAIEHTAEKYGGRLRALACGLLGDEHTAEECENDTYLEAWNSIPPHEPRSYLYAFLARITRHLALNICRDGSRVKRSSHISELDGELEECIPAAGSVEDEIDAAALSKAINIFLSELDDGKRNIFVRRYWYFDTVEDISKRFSISESKVKTTLFRCREQLKTYLEKEGFLI